MGLITKKMRLHAEQSGTRVFWTAWVNCMTATACVACILGLRSVDVAVKCLVPNGPDTAGRAYCRMEAPVEVRGSERDILRFGIGLCSRLMKGTTGWNPLSAREAPRRPLVCLKKLGWCPEAIARALRWGVLEKEYRA
jgi:hypothetical protein